MDSKESKLDVTDKIDEIKRFMPETYKSIQAKAAEVGNVAYEVVRRGLRGEANCFYAFEGGRVVGTPFSAGPLTAEVAAAMVTFGCAFVCIFCLVSAPASSPAHPPIGTPTPTCRAGNSAPAETPVAGLGESPLNSPKVAG